MIAHPPRLYTKDEVDLKLQQQVKNIEKRIKKSIFIEHFTEKQQKELWGCLKGAGG